MYSVVQLPNTMTTCRQFHDWIQKLLRGQKSGVTKIFILALFYTLIIWQKAGNLRYGRKGHGAIFDGEKFLIIGGLTRGGGEVKNEVCTLKDSTITCIAQSADLSGYANYPELFLVADDYGKDPSKC